MSGAIKSVSKVFAKVAKPVVKILPIALAAGAVFFTVGSALGKAPTFGEAVAGTLGKIGIDGTVGNALGGAITQAGIGSALGAGGALVTGADPLKGAQYGAMTGAVTGGVSGALAPGFGTDPLKGLAAKGRPDWFDNDGGVPSVAPTIVPVEQHPLLDPHAAQNLAAETSSLYRPLTEYVLGNAVGVGRPVTLAGSMSNMPMAPGFGIAPAYQGEGARDGGGWSKFFNSSAGAGLISGFGSGLATAALSGDKAKSEEKLLERRGQNYRGTSRLLTPEQAAALDDPTPRPSPVQRWQPGMRYRFNPDTNRVELSSV